MYKLSTVNDINETNQTDSIGSWALILKHPTQIDLIRLDKIVKQRTTNDVHIIPFTAYRKTPHSEKLGLQKLKDWKNEWSLGHHCKMH